MNFLFASATTETPFHQISHHSDLQYSTLKELFHVSGSGQPRGSRLMNVKQETGKHHSNQEKEGSSCV